ncbi:MAG TPA: YybS family protein [Peptostreptococcaceae bacterium]|nr:YybS family protein [Peptostreptococcaceae bacterium]
MNNRQRMTEASIITAVAIILCLAVTYLPFFALLAFVITVPYVIIASRCGIKYTTMATVVSFFILLITTNFINASTSILIYMIPGSIIGYKMSNNEEGKLDFEPIYWGTIASILAILVLLGSSQALLNVNPVESLMITFKEGLQIQKQTLESMNSPQANNIDIDKMMDVINTIIPAFLVMYGFMSAFITYYTSVFILRRTKKYNGELPKFSNFYLPGNTLIILLLLYLVGLLLGNIESINTKDIMINIQLIFMCMFLIQGLSVYTYYLNKWFINKTTKTILFVFSILLGPITYILSLVGVVDSIVDFRKVRRFN